MELLKRNIVWVLMNLCVFAQADPVNDLINSAQNGNLEEVKRLVNSGTDVNATNQWGDTPLTKAAYWRKLEIFSFLVHHGADVNTRIQGGTVLMLVAERGILEATTILIEHGADVNARMQGSNHTALTLASEEGHLDIVKLLIEHGADINAENNNGNTPLLLSLKNDHADVARFLIAH